MFQILNAKQERSFFRDKKGWTFLETLIVLGILLVLSGGLSVTGIRYLEQARMVAAGSDIAALTLALETYRMDMGGYPGIEEGLAALWKCPVSHLESRRWQGPYIDRGIFSDPWGNAYEYETGKDVPYRVISYGADGHPGGAAADRDISSSDGRPE